MRLKLYAMAAVAALTCSIQLQTSAQNTSGNLGLRTVVIDAGHGGKDPGALGKTRNVHEKHIVLAVAKKFGEKIQTSCPDVKVVYTRTDDRFLGLHDRAMVARRNNADLFISIHCNGSSSPEAKGSSVHILGQNSDNKKNKTDYFERNMSVAQRENSVIVLEEDYKTKYQTFDPDSPESYISHQLQWMAYYESSLLFATEVVNNLMQAPLTQRKTAVDQDIFQVLVEANMPAVLLELAFVTNPEEYRYLSSANGQEEVATRLFNAFKSYKMKFDQSVSVERVAVSAPSAPAQVVERQTMPEQQRGSSDYYSIQVMGLGRLIKGNDPAFKGLEIVPIRNMESSSYKYIYGKYSTLEEARLALPAVRKKFPDAFPVKVTDGNVEKAK